MTPDKYAILGELLTKEKYRFVDPKIIVSVVNDTLEMLSTVTTKTERRKPHHGPRVAFERPNTW